MNDSDRDNFESDEPMSSSSDGDVQPRDFPPASGLHLYFPRHDAAVLDAAFSMTRAFWLGGETYHFFAMMRQPPLARLLEDFVDGVYHYMWRPRALLKRPFITHSCHSLLHGLHKHPLEFYCLLHTALLSLNPYCERALWLRAVWQQQPNRQTLSNVLHLLSHNATDPFLPKPRAPHLLSIYSEYNQAWQPRARIGLYDAVSILHDQDI